MILAKRKIAIAVDRPTLRGMKMLIHIFKSIQNVPNLLYI